MVGNDVNNFDHFWTAAGGCGSWIEIPVEAFKWGESWKHPTSVLSTLLLVLRLCSPLTFFSSFADQLFIMWGMDTHSEMFVYNTRIVLCLLPFVQMGQETDLLHLWLDCYSFPGCSLAARQVMPQQHQLVEAFLDQWLSYYRRMERGEGSPVEGGGDVVGLAAALDEQVWAYLACKYYCFVV